MPCAPKIKRWVEKHGAKVKAKGYNPYAVARSVLAEGGDLEAEMPEEDFKKHLKVWEDKGKIEDDEDKEYWEEETKAEKIKAETQRSINLKDKELNAFSFESINAENKRFWKELIRIGSFIHPQNLKEKFEVTLDRMKEWVRNFEGKIVDSVPVPYSHPKDNVELIENNHGIVKKLEIRENKSLWGLLDTDEDASKKIENEQIASVSVSIDPAFLDNQGKNRGEVLRHVALTNDPYITGLAGFQLAAEGIKNSVVCFQRETNKEQEKEKNKMEKEIFEKLENFEKERVNSKAIVEKAMVELEAQKTLITQLENANKNLLAEKEEREKTEIKRKVEGWTKAKYGLPPALVPKVEMLFLEARNDNKINFEGKETSKMILLEDIFTSITSSGCVPNFKLSGQPDKHFGGTNTHPPQEGQEVPVTLETHRLAVNKYCKETGRDEFNFENLKPGDAQRLAKIHSEMAGKGLIQL